MKNFKRAMMSIGIYLLLVNNTYSQSTYLRDLEEVITQENSISNSVYILERCGGLFSAVGARFVASGRADAQAAGQQSIALGSQFVMGAVTIAETGNLNYSHQNAMTEVLAIAKIYASIMDDNHRRTGNAILGQVLADQKICMHLAKD